MKTLHLSIIISSGIIAVITFAFFISYLVKEPNQGQVELNQNVPNEQKARRLAETSLPDLQTVSGYHFSGILYVTRGGFNETSGVISVLVSYQTPSGGTMTFVEDPQMTKILNVTVLEPLRTMPQ